MSALNVFRFDDRVCLVTDSAVSLGDRLAGFCEKVYLMPVINAVIGVRGGLRVARRLNMLLQNHKTLADLLASPAELRNCTRYRLYGHFEIAVAGFGSRGPFAYYLSSKDEPFKWVPINDGLIAPNLSAAVDIAEMSVGDFDEQAIEILQIQRHGTRAGIGGHATVTTVTAEGIHSRLLCTWPDKRWSRIDPTLKPVMPKPIRVLRPSVSLGGDWRQ